MVDQVEAKHVELILQKDVIEEGRNDTNINKDGAGADGADDSNTRRNTKNIKSVEDVNTESNTNSNRTGTIQQSEDIGDIPLKDAVIHKTHASNTNNDNVDDDSNTKRNSNKTIKKRRKQHKTERDILYAIAALMLCDPDV